MKKILTFVCLTLVSGFAMFAQEVGATVKEEHFSSFDAIVVRNAFNVTLHKGTSFDVKSTVDNRVFDCFRMYLQGTTLVVEIDEKNINKEVKSSLKKKGAIPLVLSADIFVPETSSLKSIELCNSSSLSGNGKFNFPQAVTIKTSETATVKSIEIKAPKVTLQTANKSNVQANISAPEVDVQTNGNSFACLNVTGGNLNSNTNNTINIEANASSQVSLTGSSASTAVKASGSSKVYLNAAADRLTIVGKGNSNVDAHLATVNDADIDLSSSDCWVVPLKTLKIKLASNSKLVFGGNPVIDINKIASSSVTREADSKQAKTLKR